MTAMHHANSIDELATPDVLKSISGLEFMQRVLAGRLPQPPMARTMHFAVSEVAEGRVVFRGSPTFEHLNPMRGVHGGWYGTILDSCLGCAVMTTLPAGKIYTTLEFKVNLVRGLKVGQEVVAEAHVSHAGRTTAVAEATIKDAETGKLCATGNTTCLIMDAP